MDVLLFPIISNNDKKLPFYVKSIGSHDSQNRILRTMGTDEYHYIQTCGGCGKLIIDKKEFFIKKGMGFMFDPHIMHEYYAVEHPWKTRWLTFYGYAVKNFLKLIYTDWKVFQLLDDNLLEKYLDEMQKLISSHSKHNNTMCSGILYKFLLNLKDSIQCDNNQFSIPDENRLQLVLEYLNLNFSKNISLVEMANIISITPQHLCRLFKKTFSMRPFEFLTHLRIRKAKELLISVENYSVKEITLIIGYNDVSYFCAQFRELEGCTPLEFRKRLI